MMLTHTTLPILLISSILPLAVACGGDTSDPIDNPAADGGQATPDGSVGPAPAISIGACPATITIDESAPFSFTVDADHSYRIEGDGQSEGAGVVLDEGEGEADVLIGAQIDGTALGLGAHEIRVYARAVEGGPASLAICNTEVVSSLRVLYLSGYQNDNSTNMVETVLESDPRIGSVDVELYGVVNPSPPSLEEMQTYDAVVFSWWNVNSLDTGNAFGNRFADYVDAGGSLVLLGHTMNVNALLGRLVTSEYVPLRTAAPHVHSVVSSLVPVENGHEALEGVSSMNVDEHTVTTLDDDALLIAQWDDGDPLLAIKGKVVSLTSRISSIDQDLSGNWEELLANAVVVATEASAQ